MSRNRRFNLPKVKLEHHGMILGNANWSYARPNLLGTSTVLWTVPQRIASFNADTVAGTEQSPDCYLKRIDIQSVFTPVMGKLRIDGTLNDFDAARRDDIPAFSGFADTTGYTGALLPGTINNSTLLAPASWMEGVPYNLALVYEDYGEAGIALDSTGDLEDPWTSFQGDTKRVFWQKLICPTIYRPVHVNIHKVFKGRGVHLSQEPRGIYQVSLIGWGVQAESSTIPVTLGFTVGQCKAGYLEAR